MDGHYQQTMAARERAARDSAPPRRWFAYGTALDRQAFDDWRQQHGYDFFTLPAASPAVVRDLALVFDFPSRFWGGRVAGVMPAAGSQVAGVVMDVTGVDWPVVRHKEGALTGMCDELEVTLADGSRATTFTTRAARRSSDGPVSGRFVEAMLAGARAHRLGEAWEAAIRQAAR